MRSVLDPGCRVVTGGILYVSCDPERSAVTKGPLRYSQLGSPQSFSRRALPTPIDLYLYSDRLMRNKENSLCRSWLGWGAGSVPSKKTLWI